MITGSVWGTGKWNIMPWAGGTWGTDKWGTMRWMASGLSGKIQLLYDGDILVAEYDAVSGAMLRRYVHGPGVDEPLTWYEGSSLSDRRFLHDDHQDSVTTVSNSSGAPISINSYDEYGVPGTANIGRFQYTGQIWLSELGLYHYKARAYSPTLGRFLQTDPVGYKDQMNLYAYVGDDPTNQTDPNGLYEMDVHYRLTELLARAAGYSPSVARQVAAADQGVDDNPATTPLRFSILPDAVAIREKYHFYIRSETKRDVQ